MSKVNRRLASFSASCEILASVRSACRGLVTESIRGWPGPFQCLSAFPKYSDVLRSTPISLHGRRFNACRHYPSILTRYDPASNGFTDFVFQCLSAFPKHSDTDRPETYKGKDELFQCLSALPTHSDISHSPRTS